MKIVVLANGGWCCGGVASGVLWRLENGFDFFF